MKNQSVLSARGFGGVIFCGLVSFGLAAQAWAQSATFTAQAYPLVGNTHIAADFNGDGKPDLAGSGLQAASVMLNNGNGTFGPKTDYPVGDYTQDVAAGDFNGDGKMDLVITIQSPQESLAFLPGTGNFRAPTIDNDHFAKIAEIASRLLATVSARRRRSCLCANLHPVCARFRADTLEACVPAGKPKIQGYDGPVREVT